MGRRKPKKKHWYSGSINQLGQVALPEWYESELSDWSTEDILAKLREHGLSMDEATFRVDAELTPDPSNLADRWIERVGKLPGRWEDFFQFAVRRLWERFLPDRDTFDAVVDDLVRHVDSLENQTGQKWSQEDVDNTLRLLDRVEALLHSLPKAEGEGLRQCVDMVSDRHGFDLGFWLFQLPMDLSGNGYVDQAVDVARRFTFVDPGNMVGDLGFILAFHGRCNEALAQVEQNLHEFPEDAWVVMKAGDAYDRCGDPEKAVELYTRALEMSAEDYYTREGAYERLIALYERLWEGDVVRFLTSALGRVTEGQGGGLRHL